MEEELKPPRAELEAIDEELSLTTIDRDFEAEFNRVLDQIEQLKIDYQSLTLAREISRYGKS